MPITAKVPVISSAATGTLTPRPQPVCLELPVTVNGVRPVQGSDKREPFSETTRTVLVFSNGAVLRLSAALAPGQLIFLINERTKKEIVCQVVKSKNYRNVSGYVEIEFAEPSVGFWGMRFPGDKLGPGNSATQGGNLPAGSAAAPKPDPIPNAVPAAALVERPQVAASILESNDSASQFSRATEVSPAPPAVPSAPSPASSSASPKTEFPVAPPAVKPPASSGSGAESTALSGASRTKPQAEEEAETLPAWLTPAAYSSLSTPVRPPTESSLSKSIAQLQASIETNTPKNRAEDPLHEEEAPAAAVPQVDAAEFPEELPPSRSFAPFGEETPAHAGTSGGRSLLYGALAGLVLLGLGGGGWWFFQNSRGHANQAVAATAAAVQPASPAAAPAMNPAPAASAAASTGAMTQPAQADAAKSAPVSTAVYVQPAAPAEKSERLVSSTKKESNRDSSAPLKTAPLPKPAATEQAKKTAMPKLQLASPIMVRNAAPSGGGSPDINLNNMPSIPVAADPAALVASSGSQPAAPKTETLVGGDARPAKMISNVPPVYPVLAQKQHLGGSVVLNAEIQLNGSVGAVKVISGPMLLRQAALDAVKQWKYQPAMLDGKPIATQVTITVQFRAQ